MSGCGRFPELRRSRGLTARLVRDPPEPHRAPQLAARQTSDASIGLVMACTQAATELAWAHSVGQRWHVYDEFWRIATFGKLVARLDGGRRTSRKTGAADMIVSHRGTDRMRGDEQARRAPKSPAAAR
jgi:hypothetical protein